MKFFNFKLILSILLLSSTGAFAVLDQEHLGSFGKSGAWQAYTYKDGSDKVCFIFSKPISTNPSDLNRGDHALQITNWTADKTFHEASIQAGFTFKANSTATASIGDRKYKFFTIEGRAWTADDQDDKRLIKDMKNGARIKVSSTSSRGTKVTDTYSLIGFTKALAAIDKACS
tara:strand:- start:51 stop:569 length:519 start_codon:yes stop_codon:yes gene_type:complete